MSLQESSNDEQQISQILNHIEQDLTLILLGRSMQVQFEPFYRAVFVMLQDQHGDRVEQVTMSTLSEVMKQRLGSVDRTDDSLSNTNVVLKQILASIDKMMKVYFYFQQQYIQVHRNTSLRTMAINLLNHELVKQEDLFSEFLNALTTLVFKTKQDETQGHKYSPLLDDILATVRKLDNQKGSIHIFNHYLKDLYIKRMATENREKIYTIKQSHSPKQYFQALIQNYREEKRFTMERFSNKNNELILNDILRCFYSIWISENWAHLFQGDPLEELLDHHFQLVYDAMRLDEAGLKQFVVWYLQNLGAKLNSLVVTSNSSLITSFGNLYLRVINYVEYTQDSSLIHKTKMTFESWLNGDKVNIANRLNSHFNFLLVDALKRQLPLSDFQESLGASMVVFKFVKDKDMFQLAYGKSLLQRMSTCTYSRELQKGLMDLMKLQCGQSWTCNIQEISSQNPAHKSADTIVNLNGNWHALTSKQPVVMDKGLLEYHKLPEQPHKSVKWMLNFGNGVLKLNLDQTFEIKTSTKIMQIILWFNSNRQLNVSQYLQETGYQIQVIRESLLCLIREGILLPTGSSTVILEVKPELKLVLNQKYNPKGDIVNLEEAKQEQGLSLASKQELLEDRKLIVEGIMTRIMKKSKTLHKQELLRLTVLEIDGRGFTAGYKVLESSFQSLQDRGYIRQDTDAVVYQP